MEVSKRQKKSKDTQRNCRFDPTINFGKGLLKSCMHIFLEKVTLHYDKFFNHGLNDDLREAKTSTKYL